MPGIFNTNRLVAKAVKDQQGFFQTAYSLVQIVFGNAVDKLFLNLELASTESNFCLSFAFNLVLSICKQMGDMVRVAGCANGHNGKRRRNRPGCRKNRRPSQRMTDKNFWNLKVITQIIGRSDKAANIG